MNLISAVALIPMLVLAQQHSGSERGVCPAVAATLPSETKPSSDAAGARFELRRCADEQIQVVGWIRGASTPGLVINTGDFGYQLMFHKSNILVLQTLGGASDHVWVFAFRQGVPVLALKTATKDEITVRSERSAKGETVVVEVPPSTHPDESGKFPPTPKAQIHRFPVESR